MTDPEGFAQKAAAAAFAVRQTLDIEEGAKDLEAKRQLNDWGVGVFTLPPPSAQSIKQSNTVLNQERQVLLDSVATNKVLRTPERSDAELEKIMLRSQAILTNGTQQEKDLLKNELLEEFYKQFALAHKPGRVLADGTKLPPVMAVNQDLIDFAYLLLELGTHEGLQVFDHTHMNIERLRKLMSFQGDIQHGYFQLRIADYFEKYSTERLAVLNLLYENERYNALREQLYANWKTKAPFELDPRKPAHWRLKYLLSEKSNSILMELVAEEVREFLEKNPSKITAVSRLLKDYTHHRSLREELLKKHFKVDPYW